MSENISIVVPVYNEQESLPYFFDALIDNISSLPVLEIIFIDDGSKDKSLSLIKSFVKKDSRVKLICFRRNYGKSVALNEGFKLANGDIIITLDADLQDDPSQIKKLVKKLNEGYGLVLGWRKERHDQWNKKMLSKIYNTVTRLLSGVNLHDFNSGLKVYTKEAAKSLNMYGDLHRYIPVLVSFNGFEVAEVPVKHHERKYGKSKYGFNRIPKSFFDFLSILFITRFKSHPLHLFGFFGVVSFLIGIIICFYMSYLHFIGIAISRRPLLILGVLMVISGIQLVSTGLLAELITNYMSGKVENEVSIIED